nr:lipopolysaccharide biosynthesis protein [Scytonema sp. UIC 10036]
MIENIKTQLSNRFVRNLSWLGMSQMAYRVLRLGLVAIIARFLKPYDYGLGAIVLTVREFAITFSDIGIGAKLIQSDESELEDLSNSAYWLNWVIFASLFVLQCIAAFPISWVQNTHEVILPICVAGISYLIWPISNIQRTLIQRENRFNVIAIVDSLQFSLSTILSALFAIMGMGVWAFALPNVLVSPLEIIIYRQQNLWRPSTNFTTKYWKEIWSFGKNILAVGLLKTLRNNLDYWLILTFLGVEELGTYFFGFNAGLGISLSLISSVESTILPHLCTYREEASELRKSYFKSLQVVAFIIIPFVLLQSSLASIYVPVIFGKKWISAIPIVVLICLSAIPRPFADVASQLLVAIGKPHLNFRWNVLFTFLFAAALMLGIQWKTIGVAIAVLLVHMVFLPLFTLWVTNYVFGRR